jgi:hypothetical protein
MITNPEIDQDGNKWWYNSDGQFHQENGPAIITADGRKYWYQNGKPHREDGPAVECPDGNKFWYINGKRIK